jgi:hypothetical protein
VTASKSLIQPSKNPEVETIRDKRTAFWDEWRGAVTSRFQTGATANSRAPYGAFKRKPALDLIRGGDQFASRKRAKSGIQSPVFDSIETEGALRIQLRPP